MTALAISQPPMMPPLHNAFSLSPPQVVRGMGYRVQNLKELKDYFAKSNNVTWLLDPQASPFMGLREKKIQEILNTTAKESVIGRLNDSLYKMNSAILSTIKKWIPSNPFPLLPDYRYADFTRLFGSDGEPLIVKALCEYMDEPNSLGKVQLLLDLGVKINQPIHVTASIDVFELPPLAAAWRKTTENVPRENTVGTVATYLVSRGASVNQILDQDGNNLLGYLGLDFADLKLINWYVQNGGNIHFINKAGNNYFHLLALSDKNINYINPESSLKIADFLYQNQVNLTAANNAGDHPIHQLCTSTTYTDVLSFILKNAPQERYALNGKGQSTAYLCCSSSNIKLLKVILDNWNSTLTSPGTPAEIVESLLISSSEGPLSYKSNKLNEVLIPSLNLFYNYLGSNEEERRKAFVQKDSKGSTPLHTFALSSPWFIDMLLSKNIIKEQDLEIKNSQGITVANLMEKAIDFYKLHDACKEVNVPQIFSLLEKFKTAANLPLPGSAILKAFFDGLNNLYPSMPIGQSTEILGELLEFGIDTNAPFSNGMLPITYVLSRENPTLVLPLLDYGAIPNSLAFDWLETLENNSPGERLRFQLLRDAFEGALKG